MTKHTKDYLLDEKVIINQPVSGYRAAIDAVLANSCIAPDEVKPNSTILDMGSGTGAISLCSAHRLQEQNPTITGIELQPELCELSNKSAQENSFNNLSYINLDIKNLRKEITPNSFDFVITNPPYTAGGMASPNSSKATAHIEGEIDLANWITIAIKMLKPHKGKFIIVHRADRLDDIISAMHKKLGGIIIYPLISKEGGDAKRVLVTGIKSSKAPLTLKKPIIIHNEDGSYTKDADKILRLAKSINEV